ncbi:MAG TPA: twin-arginine translocase TatA/TatE family subunit [Gemmatimonadaceae bacterium]|nr:twin-arginine translocase TatA/TatE family subunit [Gemmatimonadaceae bacterium]
MGFGGFGIEKLLLIFLIVLLVFGAKRIPDIAGSMGKGIREFKKSINELQSGTMEDNVRAPNDTAQPVERSAEPPREVKRLM